MVGAYRLRLAPDELQGRVQSVATLLSLGPVPFGSLIVGVLLEAFGSTPTVLALFGVMLVVAVAALASRAVRDAPDRPEALRHETLTSSATSVPSSDAPPSSTP